MYVCICGSRLFPGQSSSDILKSNAESNIDLNLYASKYLNAAGVEFLTKLLSKEPGLRPSANDALGHWWLQEGSEEQAVTMSIPCAIPEENIRKDRICSESSHDHSCGLSIDTLDSIHHSNHPRSEQQSGKCTALPAFRSFRGFVHRTRFGRATTVSQLPLARTKPADGVLHDPVIVQKVPGSSTTRLSRAVAWMRGKSKQQDHTRNLSSQYFPVLCGS